MNTRCHSPSPRRSARLRWRVATPLALTIVTLAALDLTRADAISPEFTYQGVLTEATGAASGRYDLRFTLFDALEQGLAVAATIETNALPITNGLFTVTLNFGAVFNGQPLWLEIAERTNGVGPFVTLTPRQTLTAVPYASYALRSGRATIATAANAVTAGGVTTDALAPAAVTADKLAPRQVVKSLNGLQDSVTLAAGANVSLAANGNTLTISAAGGGPTGGWSTTGNAGTAPGLNFLGTTDNRPLEFRVNNERILRLEPAGNGFGNLIGGAVVNAVEPGIFGATIGGGGEPAWPNSVAGDFGTVAGGKGNQIKAGASNAAIGGGTVNRIENSSLDSVIAGGHMNVIERSSYYSVISGGQYNTNGYLSVGAVVPGGKDNYAGGMMSFAAGTRAKAITDGDFVWADHTEEDFSATGANQFLVRAHGGVGINTNKPQAALHVAGSVKADQFVGSGAGLTPGSVSATALAPGAVSQLGTPDGINPDAVQVANDGAVGVGTATPEAGLEVTTSLRRPAPFVLFEAANGTLDFTNLAGANCVAAQNKLVAIGASQPGSVTLVDVSPRQPVIQSVLLNGLVFQVVNPSQPELAVLQLRGTTSVALDSGRLAVAATLDDAVWLFAVTDPTQPTPLSRMKDGVAGFSQLARPTAVVLSGNRMVIAAAGDNAVTLADLADPAHPQPLAVMAQGVNGYNGLVAPSSLALSGSLLVIGSASRSTVTLVDLSTPANPVRRAEIVQGSGGFDKLHGVTGVALEGGLLAIAAVGDHAISLVDVTQPQQPRLLSVIQDGASGIADLAGARSVALNGRRLAVGASQDDAVALLDLSDPTNPRLLSEARHGVAGAHYLDGVAGMAFVGADLAVTATDDSSFTFLAWWDQSMGLVSQGWLGVGTEHPVAALDVVGNLVVQNADRVNLNAGRIELGENNRSDGTDSVALGRESVSTGYASVAGGYGARATGHESVALGDHTTAAADGAVALGTRAEALHAGSFVWADGTAGSFQSTGNNQFLIRAAGGVGIGTNKPQSALHVAGKVTATALQVTGPSTFDTLLTTNIASNGGVLTIGTTDLQPLELRVNATRALRIEPNADESWHSGTVNFVGGSAVNYVAPGVFGATIAGGGAATLSTPYDTPNHIDSEFGTIGGGWGNGIGTGLCEGSTISGGSVNNIRDTSYYSTIGGGGGNVIRSGAVYSVIGGGFESDISAAHATIGGGIWNTVQHLADYSTVGGGCRNTVGGRFAVVPGGYQNFAAGTNSLAAGSRAKALYNGDFVWADDQDLDFSATSTNQFLIRASGGVGINTGEPKATLHVASDGPTETRLTSTASGAGDWSLGTGWTGVGRPGFYLYDNVSAKARLIVNDLGSVGIGTTSPADALLDVEGNVRINDNDVFLRGESDRFHGLGWYGENKPFGDAQPDGPVLYGHAGGALATTINSPKPALSWDVNGVTVAKDLNVAGTLKVGGRVVQENLPLVNYAQREEYGELPGGEFIRLEQCSLPCPGPGFYLVLGQAMTWYTDDAWLYLFDADQILRIAAANFTDDDQGISSVFACTLSVHWVVPVSAAGPDKKFTLGLYAEDDTRVSFDSLVVIFFPASAAAAGSASAGLLAPPSPGTPQSAEAASALLPFLQLTCANSPVPPEVSPHRGRVDRLDQAMKRKDAEIEALKQRLDKLEQLVNERVGVTQ